MAYPFSSGDVLTASDLNNALNDTPKYQTFTTSVNQGGGVASSTAFFDYIVNGDWFFGQGRVTMTGSGVTNNTITVNVPVGIEHTVGGAVGVGRILDAGTRYDTVTVFANSTNSVYFVRGDTTTTAAYGVSPNMALASGDEIWFTLSYRIDL
jgi:hypothetical protein